MRGTVDMGQDTSGALDLAHLAAQTGGDQALQRELLDMFIVQSAQLVGQLAGAPPRTVGELAHKTKGSARAIGAFRLASAAAEAEREAADGGAVSIEGLVAALGEALGAIEAYLLVLAARHDA